MARPPVEWPIPVYVAELRERFVVVCRVPATALAGRVLPPIQPVTAAGLATVALAFGNGRCLKSACGSRILAREFAVTELYTPARWHPACQAPLLGAWTLALSTPSPAIRRLLQATLEVSVGPDAQDRLSGKATGGGAWTMAAGLGCRVVPVRPLQEAPWPATSAFPSQEAAEGLPLHPQCCFVPDGTGELVRSVPVHHYARSTVQVATEVCDRAGVAGLLGLPESEVVVDHVLYQKRCTHTYAFPAERIPLARVPASPRRLQDRPALAFAA